MNGFLTSEFRARAEKAAKVARSREGRRRMKYGQTQDRRGSDNTTGYYAEAFIAQETGLEWRHIETHGADKRFDPDVGYFDVRGTAHEDGHLLLHDEDEDLRPFVLVVVTVSNRVSCRVPGWKLPLTSKRPEYWDSSKRYPAYFVPQDVLLYPLPAWKEWMK